MRDENERMIVVFLWASPQVFNFLSVPDRSWRDFLCEQNSLSDTHSSQNSRWDTGNYSMCVWSFVY